MELGLKMKVIKNKNIDCTNIDNEKVMMDLNKGRYFYLNEVGSHIWELLDEKKCIKDLITEIVNIYDISEDNCKSEVNNFLIDLKNGGLIEII